jgi:hypothetical protein
VDSHQATAQTLGDLKEFKPGQKIRVSRTNAESVASQFVSFTEEGLVVHVKQGQITVARSQITKITEPSRGKRLRNTLIGLAAGGSIGAAAARGPLSSYPRDVPLAAATLILAGGGLLGVAMPAERRVYRDVRNASRNKQ